MLRPRMLRDYKFCVITLRKLSKISLHASKKYWKCVLLWPVIPLLAIAEIYSRENSETAWLWIGTRKGPEKEIVLQNKIPFKKIVSGKWRRYFSFWNFIDLIKLVIAFFQSLYLLIIERPMLVISAGGFISVPLHWAAFCFGIPAWIYQ